MLVGEFSLAEGELLLKVRFLDTEKLALVVIADGAYVVAGAVLVAQLVEAFIFYRKAPEVVVGGKVLINVAVRADLYGIRPAEGDRDYPYEHAFFEEQAVLEIRVEEAYELRGIDDVVKGGAVPFAAYDNDEHLVAVDVCQRGQAVACVACVAALAAEYFAEGVLVGVVEVEGRADGLSVAHGVVFGGEDLPEQGVFKRVLKQPADLVGR